jgi:hypothetical protein
VTERQSLAGRRNALGLFATLGAVGISSGFAAASQAAEVGTGTLARSLGGPSDFDFLAGRWAVLHRRRRRRLVGDPNWDEFTGALVNWPLLGGHGNVGDNVMNAPSGSFRGIGMRIFDPKAGEWLSWWLDGRNPTVIGDPLRGRFEDGIGVFLADDVMDGKPIKVRVVWSKITRRSALWEQAASGDGGATWEVNWTSAFKRQA